MTHVSPVAERVLDAWLELLVRSAKTIAKFAAQDLERIDVGTARLRFLLRVRDLVRPDFEGGDADVVVPLVIHVLDRNADVASGVVVMDVTDGLEAGCQPTQLRALSTLRVGTFQHAEDALHALRGRGIDIGHFRIEFSTDRLPLDVQSRRFGRPVSGAVDVVEDPVWIGTVAHETLHDRGEMRSVVRYRTAQRSNRISAGPEPAKGAGLRVVGREVPPPLSFTEPAGALWGVQNPRGLTR